eukprot:jgi/Botrbrau1/9801/Bobra.0322s0009.1
MGSVPVIPGAVLSWQTSYRSIPSESGSIVVSSTADVGPSGFHVAQRSDAQQSTSAEPSPGASSYGIKLVTEQRQEPEAPAVDIQQVSRRQKPRAERGGLNWFTLTFKDSSIESIYTESFSNATIGTDRLFLQMELLFNAATVLKEYMAGRLTSSPMLFALPIYAVVWIMLEQQRGIYMRWRQFLSLVVLIAASASSCWGLKQETITEDMHWVGFIWVLLYYGRVLRGLAAAFGGILQQFKWHLLLQPIRTAIVVLVNRHFCMGLDHQGTSYTSRFQMAIQGIQRFGSYLALGNHAVPEGPTDPSAACREVLFFMQLWGGCALALALVYVVELRSRMEFLAMLSIRPSIRPFRSIWYIYIYVCLAWLLSSNPIWWFVQCAEALQASFISTPLI